MNIPGPDYLVCTCMAVMYSELWQALAEGADLNALKDQFMIGSGCSSCIDEVQSIVHAHQKTK
ncbi:hypothetical protein J120_02800 [candidate division TM6 bacterium JCVI TM6SC1]|jgi:bacterioferritin-associated ferredoxin|uniref:BFD-like [2Fe-2S]-binding domain-containing protein n=1 Tax=candidate division TM6 bacterium JCVI TM6SC1 TaxID=1306947 RepID=A0A0D2I252_9BACT|nr:hypothetical protein J120_02800 [candidate division TM6 bacterium JCVI TM6SC1]